MGKRGPTPRPAHLRALTGNAGRRPARTAGAPYIAPFESVPPPPEFLGEVAAATWREVAPLLVEAGILTALDVQVLVTYCDAVEVWEECSAHVREHGSVLATPGGGRVRNPAGRAADAAWKTVRECSALLGLDPTSRARLVVPSASPVAANPFLAICPMPIRD